MIITYICVHVPRLEFTNEMLIFYSIVGEEGKEKEEKQEQN